MKKFPDFFFSFSNEQYKSSPYKEILEKVKARCSEKSSMTNAAFWMETFNK